jgi:hypothetical protein
MSRMRGHIAKRSCDIHGDNVCEVQGDAGSITRSEEKRRTADEIDQELQEP